MELALTFIGAAAAAFGTYELLGRLRSGRRMALRQPTAPDPELPQLPAWAALWVVLWPDRFAPSRDGAGSGSWICCGGPATPTPPWVPTTRTPS
jgi:hypothetical protein